ncbi:hypothetical protein [Affinibrenneria salicis]|uniref:hypothetical protein n=1 Tax=Affinibrenneria salicis TaxID=2590031 RepID=UPI00168A87A5|nr:hypothetical protein [Affinibrenneria salicis]
MSGYPGVSGRRERYSGNLDHQPGIGRICISFFQQIKTVCPILHHDSPLLN